MRHEQQRGTPIGRKRLQHRCLCHHTVDHDRGRSAPPSRRPVTRRVSRRSRKSVAPPMISIIRWGSTSACTSPRGDGVGPAGSLTTPKRSCEPTHDAGVQVGVVGHVGDETRQRGSDHGAGEHVAGRGDHGAHVAADVALGGRPEGRGRHGKGCRGTNRPCWTIGDTAPSWWCRRARRPRPWSGSNTRFPQADPRWRAVWQRRYADPGAARRLRRLCSSRPRCLSTDGGSAFITLPTVS